MHTSSSLIWKTSPGTSVNCSSLRSKRPLFEANPIFTRIVASSLAALATQRFLGWHGGLHKSDSSASLGSRSLPLSARTQQVLQRLNYVCLQPDFFKLTTISV
eukprot:jgi/Botrbrau1/22920/Bobra.0537s0001.1